ncbi:unnamed protein product [Cuscuta campestris]|uniref:Peptidase C1A papain C-terminal domain-containing protein n=1 Tax=Cuscuta campestris TaxID=132261 RepID=A0A484N683_9ASTE|nr:unnamed protein product [Cuscuta campestris]
MVKLKSFSYKDFESKIKDKDVLDLLVDGPVVGVLESTTQLSSLSSKEIYVPPALRNWVRHCVLITKYGEDVGSGLPYWYCRESRGQKHADKGYIKVLKQKNLNDKSAFLEIWSPKEVFVESVMKRGQ